MIRAGFFTALLGLAALAAFLGLNLVRGPVLDQKGAGTAEASGPMIPGPAKAGSPEKETVPESTEKTAEAIIRRNLFQVLVDKPVSAPAPGPETVRAPEPTRLRLALWGTVAGEEAGSRWAVIEDETQHAQSLYQEGDPVQGALIKRIERNRVILSVNGRDQVLEAKTAATSRGNAKRPSSPAHAPEAPVPVKLQVKGPLKPPAELILSLRTRPYLKKGVPAGVLVYGLRPGADVTAMGLKNGDIITKINTTPVSDEKALEAVARGMEKTGDVRFSLSRRGRKLDLTYNGKTQAFILEAAKE